ncbi:MAG TPA: type III-A CRISPR-associated RAMP protein Csm5 [Candidatus Competibacteraceae bacterium]|nr:type III-A CRISPR-associated RAMP protein Csm5 [Candidatus Competibacteraceae bacterium]
MTVYRFCATPLTPIHVGDGSSLAPEDYLIEGDHLIQFNRAATLREMNPETRRQLEERLDRNDFQAAQEILRKSVQPRHHRCRIQIGAESKADLLKAVGNPLDPVVRQRAVQGFVRNPLTGQPYLPGSALKGAIRTAVVNAFTQKHLASIKPLVSPLLENSSQRRNAWKTLETEALNFEFRRLQEDPFRLIKVADAGLPANRTRVDKVWPVKRDGKEDTKGIQMHFERLLSRGDGIEDVGFPVELELDELAAGDARVKVGRRLDFEMIRLACISFYAGRILAERRRFFAEAQPPERIFGAQGLIRINPDKVLVTKSIQERGLLLRVGRFSHFESLSVDNLRQGWNAQKKQPFRPGEEGSSRTLCRCRSTTEGTSLALPFGWLLLELEQ